MARTFEVAEPTGGHPADCASCRELEHKSVALGLATRRAELVWTSAIIAAAFVCLAAGHPEYVFALSVLLTVVKGESIGASLRRAAGPRKSENP